jgi:hypothetical protein
MIERQPDVCASRPTARSSPTRARTWAAASHSPSQRDPLAASHPAPSPPRPAAAPGGIIPLQPEFRRCSSKGCVFPAPGGGSGKCWQHQREELEPKHFLSRQPTYLVLDRAKFGLPDEEYDSSRARDRRRLAELREQFLEEVA